MTMREENGKLKSKIQIAVVALALAGIAMAQETKVYREGDAWVEEISGSLPAQRNLKLVTNLGSVHIEGGPSKNISYIIKKRVRTSNEQEARRQFEFLRVSATTQGDTVVLYGQGPRSWGRGRSYSADFEIQTPQNLELVNAHTGGGALEVNSINGRVEAETGGGNVSLEGIGGAITASSGGGAVEVGTAGSDVNIETGGGNIDLHSAGGTVYAHTGGGNIRIESGKQGISLDTGGGSIMVSECGGDLKATSGGGSIKAGKVGGQAILSTGGGSIRLASAQGPVRAHTGGGSVELYSLLRGARADTAGGGITAEFVGQGNTFTESHLDTAAGDIRVYLPENLAVTIRAAIDMASGQKIHSDFSTLQISSEGPDFGPKETFCEGNLNGGGKMLQIHTSTGNIMLLKRTVAANERNPR
jgi:DUF4097 and DUF4098 domain-containing protein YvlB